MMMIVIVMILSLAVEVKANSTTLGHPQRRWDCACTKAVYIALELDSTLA